MNARYIKDTKYATGIFLVVLIFLFFSSLLGLSSIPGQNILNFLLNPSAKAYINAFGGYSFLISIIFWGAMPSIKSQRLVLFFWPICTAFLWILLSDDLKIGWFSDSELGVVTFLANSLALPSFFALCFRVWPSKYGSAESINTNLRWLLLLMLVFALVPKSALDLTVSLHPYTYDIHALKFDDLVGLNITPQLTELVELIPGARELLWLVYGTTPLAFLAVCLIQLREQKNHLPNALLTWVVITLCAIVAYHILPITGPKYVFGSIEYISKLRESSALQLELTTGAGPNPRNGMPSMHFGWMLVASVLWLQSNTSLWSRTVMIFMTICVAIATLYLGEHYVIDLIVAVPFSLAAIALTTTGVLFSTPERWRTVALGFGCWLVWVLLLRNQIVVLLDHQWVNWLLMFCTFLVVVVQVRSICKFHLLTIDFFEPDRNLLAQSSLIESPGLSRKMGAMFFASGAAALVYQVLFAKELALVFGSTATATFTVLATFLGGMAIGSLIGGVLAGRVSRPIVAYAVVELAIAGFCVLTPTLFSGIQGAYVFLAADLQPASPQLLALRVALGAGVLLVPTVLMGITLPLLAQTLNPSGAHLGKSVAWLYACNTAGAALGALLTSYLIIPYLGAHSTTLIAALMNLLVALGALELAKSYGFSRKTGLGLDFAATSNASQKVGGSLVLVGAWLALGLGGMSSLGLEVIYVHMLSIVAGNSVYAFGLMLATFLVGLAVGGEAGRRLLTRIESDRAMWLALSQLGLAASVALGAWGWDMIPAYFASFAGYPLVTSFQSREAVRAMVCALVMVPPTVCIGMSYTLAMDLATTATTRRGITMLSWSAALNTLGNIVGVILFGFFLLPWLGGLVAAKIVAYISIGVASVVAFSIKAKDSRRWIGAGLISMITLTLISPTTLNYEMLSSGANVYFAPQNWGKVIDHAESIDGGLTTVTRQRTESEVVTTLLTNGKFQGNDAQKGEVQAQIGFAALPLLHQDRRDNALVIGYGTGATSRVFHDAGFSHLDIAELSNDVVSLADNHFSFINSRVSGLPGVQMHITDGRNLLLLTRREYDVISIEITSIWFAGAASLYNREFYKLAKKKLRQDGVLQQWVQLHHMAPTDLLTIIGTLRSEFTYVSLYVVGGQGILIATNEKSKSKPAITTLNALDTSVRLKPVRELAGRKFANIAEDLLLTPSQIEVFLERVGLDGSLWISTDNNLRLEYSTPKANASPPDRSFQVNMKLLTDFSSLNHMQGD